jgi:hypothetical protein
MKKFTATDIGGGCLKITIRGFDGVENSMVFKTTFDAIEESIRQYDAGSLIQNAFWYLSADQREFLISGMTPQQWDEMINE